MSYNIHPSLHHQIQAVDCGQALMSYNKAFYGLPGDEAVDCGQALMSYNAWSRTR